MGQEVATVDARSNGVGLVDKFVLGWGKLRRLYLTTFRPRKVERMLRLRRGECGRCGVCCKLCYTCPYLEESNVSTCLVHYKRHRNCRSFPLNERDLRDRDRVSPDTECGYRFLNGKKA